MDTVFLVISKLIGTLLRPDMWIVIALASVVLALIKQRAAASPLGRWTDALWTCDTGNPTAGQRTSPAYRADLPHKPTSVADQWHNCAWWW